MTQTAVQAPTSTGRLIGVDLARGLAVFGMYAAHVGPDPSEGGVTGFVMELVHGRSSALFAVLAGFSIVLITGRAPKAGRAGRQAVAKVVVRAAILLAMGTALTSSGAPVEVILAYYGLYFLLVLPLYRLGAGPLAMIAGGAALVFPQVLYLIQPMVDDESFLGDLLVTGNYPALTWIPFVLAGMAVARLDVADTAVRVRLALTGAGLAALGYGGSWLALHVFPSAATAIGDSTWGADAGSVWWSDLAGYPSDDTPAWLLAASPHSETTLSIVGNTGVAIAVLTTCLTVAPRMRVLARPVIAVGSMSLTAYVLNIVGIQLLDANDVLPDSPLLVMFGFIAVAMVFATLWSHCFRRGPLEWLMARATGVTRYIR